MEEGFVRLLPFIIGKAVWMGNTQPIKFTLFTISKTSTLASPILPEEATPAQHIRMSIGFHSKLSLIAIDIACPLDASATCKQWSVHNKL